MTARRMNRLAKSGENVYLAVVRKISDRGKRSGHDSVANLNAVLPMDPKGPAREKLTADERLDEHLKSVSEEYRGQLKKIIEEFHDVFPDKLPGGKPPQRGVEISIRETEGSTPPTRAPYKFSPVEQTELERQIQDLLNQGFIRPSVSPYGAPVLFVPKKNGQWRMCVDYRALNKQTIKDKFPLPRIDELLEKLGKAKVFTAIDLASGYHQIGVEQGSIEKTAFRTSRGQYEFIVMPFGLTNAPSVFQRLMNKIFAAELGVSILVYLDDILVFSETIEEHWQHLRNALARLREHRLYARVHKCTFLRDEVEYLGFDISAAGIKPSASKVEAIVNWPVPQTVRDVRSFLGLCSFYRRFVRGFSNIAAPLTELTKEKKAWDWNEDCELSFTQLKVAMTTAPTLLFPDFEKSFTLTTDASLVAVGGILQQDQGNGLQPIAYASRKLSGAESRYSAYERELLGIVWSIGQWRQYLEGRRFVVQTDHSSLRHLPNQAAIHRRIWKWVSILQGYDVDIQHIPGRRNPADALTRQHAYTDQRLTEAIREEDAKLVKFLDVPKDASDQDIQRVLDQMFSQSVHHRPAPISDSVPNSGPVAAGYQGFDSVVQDQVYTDPVCSVLSATSVQVSATFRDEMLRLLEEESPYDSIIEELENLPLTQREVHRDKLKFCLREHSLCVHDTGVDVGSGSYWRIVVPDNFAVKKRLLQEIHSVPYSGHPGYNRTLEIARRNWYWKGMASEVRDFVLECPVCQEEKGESHRPSVVSAGC